MKKKDYFRELDRRLAENKKLTARGGLPSGLAPVVWMLGTHTWQFVLFGGFLVTGLWFVVAPIELLKFVRVVLVMK